jgi:hypothetical protein
MFPVFFATYADCLQRKLAYHKNVRRDSVSNVHLSVAASQEEKS